MSFNLDKFWTPCSSNNLTNRRYFPKWTLCAKILNIIISFKKIDMKMSSAKRRIFHLGLSAEPVCSSSSAIPIGKTPVRIILWFPTTKMLIKACFLTQPLEQEGGCQKCWIPLCSKVFINHFDQMKASPECLNILIYWSKYCVVRLRRTLRRKV